MQKSFDDRYYEAIIQIRPLNEEVLLCIDKMLKKRKNVFVSKIIAEKYGYDIYISDKKYALSIGKKLKDKFKNSELKTSKSLYSYDRQSSKKKYRVAVCFRLLEAD